MNTTDYRPRHAATPAPGPARARRMMLRELVRLDRLTGLPIGRHRAADDESEPVTGAPSEA